MPHAPDRPAPVFVEDATVPSSGDPTEAAGVRLWILGAGEPHSFPLAVPGVFTIGRALDADLYVKDGSLSRLHAALHLRRGARGIELGIRDLGSVNGTRLRGVRVPADVEQPFALGEPVELGTCTILVKAGGGPVGSASAAAPTADAPVIVEAAAMRAVYALVDKVAPSELSVLVLGETGVGKEVLAQAIHARSPRAGRPFVALNCGAVAGDLIESELFGHERGAFTGAVKSKPGLLEVARGGTLFLDEIGELPLDTQVKLLRVLEERRARRVGGVEPIALDVRFVAATNRDLAAAVERGLFREDLYYRLNGFTLEIPPLRARRDEILPLARAFGRDARRREGRSGELGLTASAVAALEAHAWPGNVRELKNVIARAVLLAGDAPVDAAHLTVQRRPAASTGQVTEPMPVMTAPPPAPPTPPAAPPADLKAALESVAREKILAALERCGGNQSRAAELLGMSRKSLLRRLDTYDLPRPRKGRSDPD